MVTRTVFFLLPALAAMLISCSKEQETAKKIPPLQQESSQRAANISEPDTALAGSYFSQGQALLKAAKYDSAGICFNQASALYEKAEAWEKYIFSRELLGEALWRAGSYEKALTELQDVLAIALQKIEAQHVRIASIYNQIGNAYHYKGEPGPAKKFYAQGLEMRQALLGEQHVLVAASYNSLGNAYFSAGDYDQAFALQNKALAIRHATLSEQSLDLASSYNGIGNVYAVKGDYEQAIMQYDKAITLRLRLAGELQPELAASYMNLGNVYSFKGDYDEAIDYYRKALLLFRKLLGENHPHVALSYYNMALAYSDKSDFDQAINYLEKALAIQRLTLGEQNPDVGRVYDSMGIAFYYKGDYDQALANYQKALAIQLAELGEQSFEVSNIYLNQGAAYNKKGDFNRALALYNEALSIRSSILTKPNPHIVRIYQEIADACEQKGLYDKALENYQQALQANLTSPASSDPYDTLPVQGILSENQFLLALTGKARTFFKRYARRSSILRDLEAAVATYQLASQLIDQTRSGYKAEGSKLFLAKEATSIYDQAIQTALQLYHVIQNDERQNAAFLFAEKNKAGVMLESLAEAEAKQFAGIPDSLLEKERRLRIDLAFYERSLTDEQLLGRDANSAKIDLWQDKVFNLKQAYDALLQRFEQEYPDYYNLKYQVKTVSVPEVQQQLLDDETALVEYFTGKDSIFIFAITKESFIVKVTAKDSLFERQIEQLRQGITQQDFDTYTQVAYQLYQTLLQPIAANLDHKNLIIVPDDALSAIPFEALITTPVAKGNLQDYANLPYLLNAHAISYAYSATLLQQEQNRKNREIKRDYLAFAPIFAEGVQVGTRGADFFAENFGRDSSQTATRMREGYLPDTKREVTGILDRFENSYGFFERWLGSKSRVYLEREANETRLKSKDIADYRFLHFATHGLVNEKNPKLSGLLLAQEDTTSKEDGILHLGEIYNLSLNADLVVLSACETGLGQIAKGEGIIGLTRGFLYAGAKNLLVSLWQVSDVTTADLMVDFYSRMLQGATKPEALAEAKRHLIRRGSKRAKPDYWAPFILIGK
jgi:CHAT domain-containing protein/lipopolysaccharide biosynthesis regulator YciM